MIYVTHVISWFKTTTTTKCIFEFHLHCWPTLCDPMNCSPPGFAVHEIFQAKDTGVGCHFLLQGIFPTQGLNPCLLLGRHLPLRYLGSLRSVICTVYILLFSLAVRSWLSSCFMKQCMKSIVSLSTSPGSDSSDYYATLLTFQPFYSLLIGPEGGIWHKQENHTSSYRN